MTSCLHTNEIAVSAPVKPAEKRRLPGDLAMWFFILMELTVFAIFFIGFSVAERLNPALFSSGRQSLHLWVGLVCTLVLVISSYFVALAVVKVRQEDNPAAKTLLMTALMFAAVYLGVKLWEYRQLIALGYDLSTDTFYTLYFFTTAFHFMHVLLGMIILAYMAVKAGKNAYSRENYQGFEAGAAYWHMVDLVWVLLFFLVYVVH
ncbi:cytochrome c oxidase subunit 3 family protein [Thalassomonas viridans]|uniref:Cytochrome c oxidase subunit 3 family protein n=1 Tax=Thalassomonas viridans TaxID=137584 RepID=A0AAE9Z9E7_9GAMM|nr:cytochrome c oxidase subunit 3 family protein [Thalassomonas viridans]WDE08434.1 cytochrome c oxidase subunit 3 family protein [Thalassomonas viridans]